MNLSNSLVFWFRSHTWRLHAVVWIHRAWLSWNSHVWFSDAHVLCFRVCFEMCMLLYRMLVCFLLRFPKLNACSRNALAFAAWLVRNSVFLRVWRTCALPTSFFWSSGSRFGTREPDKLNFHTTFVVHILKTSVSIDSKSNLCPPIYNFWYRQFCTAGGGSRMVCCFGPSEAPGDATGRAKTYQSTGQKKSRTV